MPDLYTPTNMSNLDPFTVGRVHVSAGNVNRFTALGARFEFKDVTPVLELHKRHPERIQTLVVDHDKGLLRGHGRLVHRHIGMDAELAIIKATVKHGIWNILVAIALLYT